MPSINHALSYSYKTGAVSVSVFGIQEVRDRLHKMADHLQYRLLVEVMKKSLEKALLEAQARAPMGGDYWSTDPKKASPGRLKRSFRIKKMRSANPFVIEVQLQNVAYYALWVEYGHRIVKGRKNNARVVGTTRPKPFMRPTFEGQKGVIELEVLKGVKAGLARRGL